MNKDIQAYNDSQTGDVKQICELLAKEIRILEISQKISSHTQERVSRMTKEAILREQMRSIEEELGETAYFPGKKM